MTRLSKAERAVLEKTVACGGTEGGFVVSYVALRSLAAKGLIEVTARATERVAALERIRENK